MSRNECVDRVMDELERYGLKGQVIDRTKHLEIAWETPVGRRFVVTSKTPSDWRSSLNIRGDVRRMLKADNLQPQRISSLSFQRAMSLPKEVTIPRDQVLQNDVDALTDMVVELQQQMIDLMHKMQSARIVSRIEFGKTEQIEQPFVESNNEKELIEGIEEKFINGAGNYEAPPRNWGQQVRENPFRLGSTQNKIYALLTDQWQHFSALVGPSGVSQKFVQVTLSKAKKKGYAQNGMSGMWRRKA